MTTIYVFGSNRAGRHGKGDALTARLRHGAIYGQGEGLQGRSYGIPTKDGFLRPLSLPDVAQGVARFLAFAHAHPELTFDVQGVGCGLAGFLTAQIAPLFSDAPPNCYLEPRFVAHLRDLGVEKKAGPPPSAQVDAGQATLDF
ncbi:MULTISPECIES: A1S_2505 family phage non-structural protein [unclassified Variovorax]|uniref:A1S_2505 family phage non-structural protein n=1 Tax=unclassified Variovorax TaxID=663243 RepID=UPI001315DAAA|nr:MULTISPECIES: hypothetical protein [unclassified Variovorax]VTU42908.1 hypothetical protein H6P1_00309 [Variovorax sp. PBL-H6]